jgi:hypothetical protein
MGIFLLILVLFIWSAKQLDKHGKLTSRRPTVFEV